MLISIICSDFQHPVFPYLQKWAETWDDVSAVKIVRKISEVDKADILFLISCSEIISAADRARFGNVFVIHGSDLPSGRGWSPVVWQVLAGQRKITISLIEAQDPVDTGDIWAQEVIDIEKSDLFDDINEKLFQAELRLMSKAVTLVSAGHAPKKQNEDGASYFRKRTPADSEINPNSSIAEAFDAIRIADPNRYPAFFRLHGQTYAIELRKLPNDHAID